MVSEKSTSCEPIARRRYATLLSDLIIAFLVITSSVVLSAAGGGMIGKTIATWFPHYYTAVFPQAATQPWFDAAEIGVATGIGQGAAVGVIIGLVIVLALAIASRRYVYRAG